jgi:ribose 5-phosphate isomerase B
MIALACDHGALELKEAIKAHLEARGLAYKDFGTYTKDSCDYPDFGAQAARAVAAGECDRGIVCCTTGIGISIAANKIKGVRCALRHDHMSARLTRQHNDANMMALGAAVTPPMMAMEIIDIFLDTEFQGGRHQRRVDKLAALEG